MFRNKKWLVLTALVLTGILVAACAPQPAAPDTSAALEEAQARIAELEARLAEAGDEEAIAELLRPSSRLPSGRSKRLRLPAKLRAAKSRLLAPPVRLPLTRWVSMRT